MFPAISALHRSITACPTTCTRLHTLRHVILPKELAKSVPKSRLLSDHEWRSLGVQQSRGWQHYAIHKYVARDLPHCRACHQHAVPATHVVYPGLSLTSCCSDALWAPTASPALWTLPLLHALALRLTRSMLTLPLSVLLL